MKYYTQNGIKIIECQPEEVSIALVDRHKKNITDSTYVNLGFFAAGTQNGYAYTYPVGATVCDVVNIGAKSREICSSNGKFENGKYICDFYELWGSEKYNRFYHKPTDVFAIANGKPVIERIIKPKPEYSYCASGISIMKNGVAANYQNDVIGCGWQGNELYGTFHIFIGLKAGSNTIYVMDMRTHTGNMVTSKEAYKKFRALGLTDVLKFDGGGSEIMRVDGAIKHATLENRRISTALVIKAKVDGKNPYPVPKRTLVRGRTGDDVRWLQWQLVHCGFDPKGIDGSFGGGCYTAVKAYQKSHGLAVDGSVGPATRESLITEA